MNAIFVYFYLEKEEEHMKNAIIIFVAILIGVSISSFSANAAGKERLKEKKSTTITQQKDGWYCTKESETAIKETCVRTIWFPTTYGKRPLTLKVDLIEGPLGPCGEHLLNELTLFLRDYLPTHKRDSFVEHIDVVHIRQVQDKQSLNVPIFFWKAQGEGQEDMNTLAINYHQNNNVDIYTTAPVACNYNPDKLFKALRDSTNLFNNEVKAQNIAEEKEKKKKKSDSAFGLNDALGGFGDITTSPPSREDDAKVDNTPVNQAKPVKQENIAATTAPVFPEGVTSDILFPGEATTAE